MPDVTPGPVGQELQDFPVGTVVLWGSSTVPVGWLLLNGQSISQAAYPALYALFPSTTLPDMRARVAIGYDGSTYPINGTGGAESVTLTPSQMGIPNHTHTYSDRYPGSTNTAAGGDNDTSLQTFADHGKTTGGVTEANASQAHNNMQPYITLNFIVKAY